MADLIDVCHTTRSCIWWTFEVSSFPESVDMVHMYVTDRIG